MLELLTLGLFVIILLMCVIFNISILSALICGFIVFFTYGIIRKFTAKEMFLSAFEGVKTIKNIVIILFIIGILTAVWRMAGTIPAIIFYSTKIIKPQFFILITFILCCMLSVLTGTAFGTAATIGVICMTMAETIGVSPMWIGGAILSGSFFGDRCSPMSTSCLLVSKVTDTDIFKNIKNMMKTAIVPFIITCIIYLIVGLCNDYHSLSVNMAQSFAEEFNINIITIIPALIIIIFSIFKIGVRHTMEVSILVGTAICFLVQDVSFGEFARAIVVGFKTDNEVLGPMINGGGIVSMINVILIIIISSSYSGMFEKTNILSNIKEYIEELSDKITPFGTTLVTAALTSMISCNQTLAIILTNQLCRDMYDDKYELSINLADSVVLMAALIPWSIACTVPLSTVGAPINAVLAACYLYVLPIVRLIGVSIEKKSEKAVVLD